MWSMPDSFAVLSLSHVADVHVLEGVCVLLVSESERLRCDLIVDLTRRVDLSTLYSMCHR
jgi:hypothetical protein